MIYFVIIVICVGAMSYVIWHYWQEEKYMKNMEQNQVAKSQMKEISNIDKKKGTRDLFIDILTNMGCQYRIDDEKVYFPYQGEHFCAVTTNDSIYVDIWDVHWNSVDINNVDEVVILKEAINNINMESSITTLYSVDKEDNELCLHCKTTIPFFLSIPDLEAFLKAYLELFFRTHRLVVYEMYKLREEREK